MAALLAECEAIAWSDATLFNALAVCATVAYVWGK